MNTAAPLTQDEIQARAAALATAAKANTAPAPQTAPVAAPVQRPSIGRIVHFHDAGRTSLHPATQTPGPFAAIITGVDQRGLHLHVFKPAAPGIHAGFVKHKSQLGKNEPQRYWEWPPVVTG